MPRVYLFILASLLSIAHIQACEQPAWGQCGGLSWQGCTQCAPGLTCKEWNSYYSQCVPATTTTTSSSTSSPTTVTSTSVSTTSTSTSTSTLPVYPESSTGLSMYAKRHGKYIGSAYDVQQISDNSYTNVVLSNINLLTCQNSMKWDATEPNRNNFLTTSAEKIVSIAELNGRRVRGHTLVWHSQLPAWVSSGGWNSTTLTQIVVNHITRVVSKFQKRIHTWNVVNEPLNEDGTLRQSVFYKVLGEAYIDLAFNTTRLIDNQPILAINEYNIESAGAKATGMINLVTRLKNRGVPVDQIGVESHLILGAVPNDLNTTLTSYTALGVSVAITELDVRIPLPSTPEKLAQQASDYVRVVDVCLDIPKCLGVTFWTMSDKWSEVPLIWVGTGEATLFDKNIQPKPAYTAVQTLIKTKTRNSTVPL